MIYNNIEGVPAFQATEYHSKKTKYCVCIPIINENRKIQQELLRAKENGVDKLCDIILCDGGSTDGATEDALLKQLGVNTLLVKLGEGKQGAQLRMGFWWALQRGYAGVITIDGNNKDSIEDILLFIDKLDDGFDFIQGSRFVSGGKAINTPFTRHLAVRLLHAPLISLAARHHFTDTTNAFRGHSKKYLTHSEVAPFRDIFSGYELLAYLSCRASQLGLLVTEVPVMRFYPKEGGTPTKISFFRGNINLFKVLILNLLGKYKP